MIKNMLIVLLKKIEPWFKYIWEQFIQINSLKTEYTLMEYSAFELAGNKDKSLLIEYNTKQIYPESLFIVKKNYFKTDDYTWIREDLPVYRASIVEGKGGKGYDIFFNAFVHLSRLEEWEKEKKGRFIHSYSINHPRKDKRIWRIPIVNYLFNELEQKIKTRYPEVHFGNKEKPVIEFSHDVDYIEKTIQLRIKQTGFHFYNFGRLLLGSNFKKGFSRLAEGFRFAFSNCDYWCFDQWTELERKLNIKSVFYFFSQSKKNHGFRPRKWLIEPSYDIASNTRLGKICKELLKNGNVVGIHGSYSSACDETLFKMEKESLENSIGATITKGRQHWLSYYENITPCIYEKSGIMEDSTMGFNDIPGFRAGIASKYNPYNHRDNRPFSFREIPLVIMDSHLHDYSKDPDCDLRWLYTSMERVKSFSISVDWHQRAIHPEYQWGWQYYELAKKKDFPL